MSEKKVEAWRVDAVTADKWDIVLEWARSERWDIGLDDVSRFFNTDEQGFFVGYVNDVPVSSVSIVNFSDSYTHLGHYLAASEYRGQGWGHRVWKAAIPHAGERTIGLDGMPTQEKNYSISGFETHYRTLRLIGAVNKRFTRPEGIEQVSETNLEEVIAYDTACTGISRGRFLANWFQGEQRTGFLTRSAQGVTGLVGVRRSDDGYRMGPFYADDAESVDTLFAAAMAEVPEGVQVTVDAPESDNAFMKLANSHGLKEVFYTFRMYRGAAPVGQPDKVMAISSLELG